MQDIISKITSTLKLEAERQYGSIYAYAKKFDLNQSDCSKFFRHNRATSLKLITKHANNLGYSVTINIYKNPLIEHKPGSNQEELHKFGLDY